MNSWRDDLKELSDKMEALSKENARLRDALEKIASCGCQLVEDKKGICTACIAKKVLEEK